MARLLIALFLSTALFGSLGARGLNFFNQVDYNLTSERIDVVIPCTEKDLVTLDLCIDGIRRNGANIGRVIVVSAQYYTAKAEWFDERLYPFTKEDISAALYPNASDVIDRGRVGWVFQQLLKLYAYKTIPQISSNVLVLDADTIFLNPVAFLTAEGGGLYSFGPNINRPFYFEHAQRLLPGLRKVFSNYSGIAHHMLFQKSVLEDFFFNISHLHKCQPWEAIIRSFDINTRYVMSEYELYFNYVFAKTAQVQLRPLLWADVADIGSVNRYRELGYHFVSCHAYLR